MNVSDFLSVCCGCCSGDDSPSSKSHFRAVIWPTDSSWDATRACPVYLREPSGQ